ncbi:MAG: hypothetical protein ACE37H_02370 [Phycisphaeraceae bacterium]
MTLRYLAVVLLLTAIGAGLLGLRQQQLGDKHAIAEHHAQMKRDREAIKDLQVRIAKRTTPQSLQDAVDRARLDLEPITRGPEPAAPEPDGEQQDQEQDPRDG